MSNLTSEVCSEIISHVVEEWKELYPNKNNNEFFSNLFDTLGLQYNKDENIQYNIQKVTTMIEQLHNKHNLTPLEIILLIIQNNLKSFFQLLMVHLPVCYVISFFFF